MDKQISAKSNADLLMTLCGPAGRTLAKRPLTEIFGMVAPKQSNFFAGEQVAVYEVHPQIAAAKELYIRTMHESLCFVDDVFCTNPEVVNAYLCGHIGNLEYEAFWCLWTDSQNRLIAADQLVTGTLTQASVYPREIVKMAMNRNAAAVIFAHNHPSGNTTPSRADEHLTKTLKQALALVDVRCLDHIIVAGNKCSSFAAMGLL